MTSPLLLENVWLQQQKFEEAELVYRQSHQSGTNNSCNNVGKKASNSLAGEIAQVRDEIKKVLDKQPVPVTEVISTSGDSAVYKRLDDLERENKDLRKVVDELRSIVISIQASIKGSVKSDGPVSASPKPQEPPVSKQPAPAADDDDDCDLFGSDDEEAIALKEKRLKEYAEKKAKKPAIIAKSSILLDVKPWDDETDMAVMEKKVRSIQQNGLVWGASKLVPVGYGIKKLSIICVVEDDKVSVEELSEKITEEIDDLVQSVDVAAFNKI